MKLDLNLEFLIELAYEQGYLTTKYSNAVQRWALSVFLLKRKSREERLAEMRSVPAMPQLNVRAKSAVPKGEESEPMSLDEAQEIEALMRTLEKPRTTTLADDEGWI